MVGTNRYADTQGSDVVVITAGFPRKPGMSRDDLLGKNGEIVRGVVDEIVRYSPDAILIVVTNPLDAMAQLAFRASKFPKHRVIGMAGVLDAARFRASSPPSCKVSVENTHAFVLGGHGDQMVPLPRYSTVAGIPITELLWPRPSRGSSTAPATAAPRSSEPAQGRLRLLCAVGSGGGDGRGHRQGQEEDPALRRLS